MALVHLGSLEVCTGGLLPTVCSWRKLEVSDWKEAIAYLGPIDDQRHSEGWNITAQWVNAESEIS